MQNINKKDYFNSNWKDIDIALVPIKFSLTSKKIRQIFINLLTKNNSIADLGCGLGGNSIIFQKINPNVKYTGIDISSEAIIKAKKINQNKNTHFFVKDLEKDNLPTNSFSIIYCSQLIEHIKKDRIFLSKIHQSLKPKGYLLISTVFRKAGATYLYKNIRGERVLAPDHINEYTDINNLLKKLKKCHYKNIEYDLTLFRYPLIDIGLKFLMKHYKSKIIIKLVNSSPIMFLRYYLCVPIFGFYNFQVITQKT